VLRFEMWEWGMGVRYQVPGNSVPSSRRHSVTFLDDTKFKNPLLAGGAQAQLESTVYRRG